MIELEINHSIATVTLNRPEKLHALTLDMLHRLDEIVTNIDHNEEVRAVLLTGAGAKAFCVGADIHAWTALQPLDMWRRWIRDGHRVFDHIAQLRQPVIAALNGYTLGGGLELALTADIRLAADHVRLGQPEVKLATVPGWGGTQRLPALIGAARAKQMMFSGEQIDTQTALLWGLVNEVHPADYLMPRAKELALQIAANAPMAVQFVKQSINAGLGYTTGMTLESLAGALAAMTEDALEGKRAFQAQHPGEFKGQ